MMNDKVMVRLCIPVTGIYYDILLPKTISVGGACRMISEFFRGQHGGAYDPDERAVLCSMDDGTIYDVNMSVESLKLKNGSKLMLI